MEAVIAGAHVNAGPNSTAEGWGDLTVSPSILQWNGKQPGAVTINQRVVFDFDLPVVHYLWSSENTEPPRTVGARSIQPRQAYHFNATLSYQIAKHVWLGANGYFLKQITDPEINGIALEDSPEQVGAIGPGAAWNHSHWFLYMNGSRELGAENRPTGNKIVIRAEKVF